MLDRPPHPDRQEILRANRQAYDRLAEAESPLCRPAKDSELSNPLATVDVAGWLGDSIAGRRVLCLAAAGGRQSALYAAAGADVTVVDLSGAMLELDRRVAAERGYSVRLVNASMEELPMLIDGEFDIVVHPVSTCYVPDVRPVFLEVARVLRAGGIYVSQHKTPTSLQTSTEPNDRGRYELVHPYYRDRPLPTPAGATSVSQRIREDGAVEFLHRWEQIIGGICRAGFVIEDLVEPMHARKDAAVDSFGARASYVAPYVRIKARRRASRREDTDDGHSLWLPT